MDGFGFIDDTMTYDSAWAAHDAGTATLPPGVVSSEDPNYWVPVGMRDGLEETTPVPTPLEERVYSAGHRIDHLDLDQNGFVKDGTFEAGFSGQEYVNKKLEAKGFGSDCCGSCAHPLAGNTAAGIAHRCTPIDAGAEKETSTPSVVRSESARLKVVRFLAQQAASSLRGLRGWHRANSSGGNRGRSSLASAVAWTTAGHSRRNRWRPAP